MAIQSLFQPLNERPIDRPIDHTVRHHLGAWKFVRHKPEPWLSSPQWLGHLEPVWFRSQDGYG